MQVTIGIPSQGTWVDVMGLSLVQAITQFPHDLHVSVQRGPYLAVAREACLLEALQVKSDYLVFIDTDMAFPTSALPQLLAHGKDVIGGAYNEKRTPPVSTVKLDDGTGKIFKGMKVLPNEPFQCIAVATGFMAVNLHRLTACMAPPFFTYAFDGKDFMGEDVQFCMRAKAAGLEVWCDPTIPLKHIGQFAY